jgi:endonuclease/exonuclease/phosphatase (EEP) superfamily protein YafD
LIYRCPYCNQKNRLPDNGAASGTYVCGRCKAPLPYPPAAGVTGGSRHSGDLRLRLGRPPRWLVFLTTPYALALLILGVANALGPERWWFTGFNLYMPQWIWGVPGAFLLLLTLIFAWRWAFVPLLLVAWVAGPLMGFRWNVPPDAPPGARRLRVMTYNVKWGWRDGEIVAAEVARYQPDLLLCQDSAGALGGALGTVLKGWNVKVSGQYIIASRLPLSDPERLDISYPADPDHIHHAVRARLTVGDTQVTICNVHLLSPRYGLISVRSRDIDGIERNCENRLVEARRLAGYLRDEQGPLILTGDLNAPQVSLVCREFEALGLRDSFVTAGRGYGYTYGAFTKVRHRYVRIDHIFVSPQFGVVRSVAGTDEGSDHCPVIADIYLRQR